MVTFLIVRDHVDDDSDEAQEAVDMARKFDLTFTIAYTVAVVCSGVLLLVLRHFALLQKHALFTKLYPGTLEIVQQDELQQLDAATQAALKRQQ